MDLVGIEGVRDAGSIYIIGKRISTRVEVEILWPNDEF